MPTQRTIKSIDGLSGLPLDTYIDPLKGLTQEEDNGFVSIRGMWEIRAFIEECFPKLGDAVRSKARFDDLVSNKMVVTDKNYLPQGNTGKIAKRIQRWAYREYKCKFSPDQLERIGEISDTYKTFEGSSNKPVMFDFVDKINWKAGEFGDKGSCFWGGRDAIKELFPFYGVKAVRFYTKSPNSDDGLQGFARAWVHNDFPKKGYFIIFNAYGLILTQIASNLVSYLSRIRKTTYNYWEVNLVNNERISGTVYINNGIGIVIGPDTNEFDRDQEFDMNLDASAFEKVTCRRCKKTFYKKDMVAHSDWHSYFMCHECINEGYTICSYRGSVIEVAGAIELYNGTYVTYDCANQLEICDSCGGKVLRNHMEPIYLAQHTFFKHLGRLRVLAINPDKHENWGKDIVRDEDNNYVHAFQVCPHCSAKNELPEDR